MWAMVVAHLLLVPAAHAYLDPVYITPVTPNAGQEIEINVGVGDCDTITSEPGYPQVTREGNQIRVLLFAVRYEDIELCFLPHGTATVPFGAFEAGDYQVTVDVFYADAHGVPQTDTMGVLPMSIAGISPPVSVPASTPVSLFVLAVGLIALARKRKEWVAVLLMTLTPYPASTVRAADERPHTIDAASSLNAAPPASGYALASC